MEYLFTAQVTGEEAMVRNLGIVVIFLSYALCACADETKPQYAWDVVEEMAKSLPGDINENRQKMALFAFKIVLVQKDARGLDISRVLAELERMKPEEVLPVLEESLRFGVSNIYAYSGNRPAINLWVRMKTEGLSEEDKIKLFVSTCTPGFPLFLQDVAFHELEKFGIKGRQALYDMILSQKGGLVGSYDYSHAREMGLMLRKSKMLRPTGAEIEQMSMSNSVFQKMVAYAYLNLDLEALGSPIFYKVRSDLIKADEPDRKQVLKLLSGDTDVAFAPKIISLFRETGLDNDNIRDFAGYVGGIQIMIEDIKPLEGKLRSSIVKELTTILSQVPSVSKEDPYKDVMFYGEFVIVKTWAQELIDKLNEQK